LGAADEAKITIIFFNSFSFWGFGARSDFTH